MIGAVTRRRVERFEPFEPPGRSGDLSRAVNGATQHAGASDDGTLLRLATWLADVSAEAASACSVREDEPAMVRPPA